MKVFSINQFNSNYAYPTKNINFRARGIYPGSFDPITNGHLDIINRARNFLDSLIVGVGLNSEKSPFLTQQQRVNLIRKIVKPMGNVSVEAYEGMTVDFAKDKNAKYMIRGVRNSSDYIFEQRVLDINRTINPEIDTIILPTSPSVSDISSTLVRNNFTEDKDISFLVPKPVEQLLFLKKNLQNTLANIEINKTDAKEIFNDFVNAYDSIGRGYHGLEHIETMLRDFVNNINFRNQVKNYDMFKYAIFMHDYKNGLPNDVVESAKYALNLVKHLSEYNKKYINKLIMATDYEHSPEITTFDEALIQDLDLAILGKNSIEYKKYSASVRQEYAKFDNSIYNPARIKLLQKFLSKNYIYNTPYFRNNFESSARKNIQLEIKSLL